MLHPCLGGGRCFPEHIAETCCVGEDRGSLLSTYCMPGHVQSPLRKLSHLFPTADVWAFNTFRETHPLHSPVPLVEAPMVHVTLGNRRCPDAQLMAPGLAESVLLPKCHFLRHKSRHRKSLPIVRKSGAVLVPPTAGVAWAPRTATGLEGQVNHVPAPSRIEMGQCQLPSKVKAQRARTHIYAFSSSSRSLFPL